MWADNDADLNDQFRTFSREQSTFHLTSVIMGGLNRSTGLSLVWTWSRDGQARTQARNRSVTEGSRRAVHTTHIYCPDIMKMPISCAWVQCSGRGTDGNGLAVSWPPASSRLLMTHSAA